MDRCIWVQLWAACRPIICEKLKNENTAAVKLSRMGSTWPIGRLVSNVDEKMWFPGLLWVLRFGVLVFTANATCYVPKSYMVDCKLLQNFFESRTGCLSSQFRLLHFVLILDMCSLLFRLVASMMQEERSQFSRFYFLSCLSTYFVATSCHAL